jgi:hypothetical protein
MPALSNYLRAAIGNLVQRGVAYTSPGEIFLALYTSNPTSANSGTETTYTNYVRVSCGATPSAAFSAVDGTGLTQNQNTITFPAVGGASPVTLTHWALFDTISVGNMLLFGPLLASKTLDPTDVPSFPATALKVTYT